jgi:hypothetical protein
LVGANDLRSGEDRHTSVKLAEHQIAIAELRHRARAAAARAELGLDRTANWAYPAIKS